MIPTVQMKGAKGLLTLNVSDIPAFLDEGYEFVREEDAKQYGPPRDVDLKDYSVAQLRKLAIDREIEGAADMRKSELIAALKE